MMVKFLIIRFSSIGDIVLTTPVIRCLHTQVEDAEIHFLTKKQFEPVLKANPFIHKLWLLEDNLSTLLDELEDAQTDYIIDLHNNLRTGIVKKRLKLASFSFNKINLQKWLIVNLKIDRLPQKHIVDRYLETTRIFDVKNDGAGLDYFISEEDKNLPLEIEKRIPERFVSLVIGAQHTTKKMPSEIIAQLCDLIKMPVVILGGPGDMEESAKITELSNHTKLIDTCGKLSLNQSAELIRRSDAVLSHDTGLMHIAAAFKKLVFSLWGNTIPEFGMYPYLPDKGSKIFEVKGLSCRPCSKIGYNKCPKKHFDCMRKQDINAIAEAVNQA
jgi:ADP-heptose:LPS heptosyltransferase